MQLFFDGNEGSRSWRSVFSSRSPCLCSCPATTVSLRSKQSARGLSGRGICHGVAHRCSRTARSHRQLPEENPNPYHANSRDRPRLYRYKTIQLQTERFGFNSIDARRRAITCLHTELSHSVCHESSSQGRHAGYRPGAGLQEVEQVLYLKAITFEIG